jgi:Spy/CpxP family protein refolding chaperone
MKTRLACLWRGVLCSLVAAVVVPGVALAQGQGRGGFGGGFGGGFPGQGGGVAGLLLMEEVQTELKLTDEQKTKLRDSREELRGGAGGFGRRGGGAGQAGGEGAPNFRDMSREERQKFMEDARKRMEEQSKKAEELVKGMLTPEQMTRLNELRIQQQGVRAMGRPEVAAALKLTDAQKEAIDDILEAARPQRGPGGGGGGFGGGARPSAEDREKARAEAEERTKKTQADIDAVLTETQKAEWVKLQGTKFTFPERPAFGQGGRGGRGGQGGEGGEGAPGGRQNRRQRPNRPAPEA